MEGVVAGGWEVRPYAQGKRWTLYAGDCAEIAPAISGVDALISDPPYGMSWNTNSRRFTGGVNNVRRYKEDGRDDFGEIANDAAPFDPTPWLAYPRIVLFGANHFAAALPVRTWLVWVKRSPELYGSFLSDAELAWMKGGHGVYCHEEQFPPPSRMLESRTPGRTAHPTQKPIALMSWCMERAKVPPDALVLDPYAGSGSTGDAALRSGRRFAGIELDPRYLDIAARRLAEAEDNGVQSTLFGAP